MAQCFSMHVGVDRLEFSGIMIFLVRASNRKPSLAEMWCAVIGLRELVYFGVSQRLTSSLTQPLQYFGII